MKKLLKFASGEEIISEGVYIHSSADLPLDELDISFLSDEEFKQLKLNPKNKEIRDKIDKRIKNK